MKRMSGGLLVLSFTLILWMASASAVHAQMVCYPPAPAVAVAPVTSYYAPPPVMTYYAPAPAVSYYAPAPVPVVASYYAAPAATTYRYGPFGRLRSVSSYYGAPAYAPAPVVARYGYYYP